MKECGEMDEGTGKLEEFVKFCAGNQFEILAEGRLHQLTKEPGDGEVIREAVGREGRLINKWYQVKPDIGD